MAADSNPVSKLLLPAGVHDCFSYLLEFICAEAPLKMKGSQFTELSQFISLVVVVVCNNYCVIKTLLTLLSQL